MHSPPLFKATKSTLWWNSEHINHRLAIFQPFIAAILISSSFGSFSFNLNHLDNSPQRLEYCSNRIKVYHTHEAWRLLRRETDWTECVWTDWRSWLNWNSCDKCLDYQASSQTWALALPISIWKQDIRLIFLQKRPNLLITSEWRELAMTIWSKYASFPMWDLRTGNLASSVKTKLNFWFYWKRNIHIGHYVQESK